MMRKPLCQGIAAILLAYFSMPLNAQSSSAAIAVRGTLVYPPPCTFPAHAVSIDFGDDLLRGDINGVRYEMPVDPQLDCSSAPINTLRLRFVGAGAPFNAQVLDTDHQALAIELRHQGVLLPLGQWVNFTDVMPALSAVPVKDPNDVLQNGAFTATVTLEVDYQ